MLKLLNKPCLPENKVAVSVVSSEQPEIIRRLHDDFMIESIIIDQNKSLSDDISSHPDCVFLQLDTETVFSDINKSGCIVNFLTNKEYVEFNTILSSGPVCSPYPGDIRLNVRVIGNNIICNSKYIDINLKNYAEKSGFRIIHCNQGYAACSSIVLNDNALITDDPTIHSSAQLNGIDSVIIRKGSVKLKCREYGFIGGTCGMIDKNILAFTGCLDSHIDSALIKSFLNKHSISYVELTDGPLVDIGGIIPLFELC